MSPSLGRGPEAGSTNADPSPALEEEIKSRLGLNRGRWKMLLQLLELPTTFQIRPTEFPPVSAQLEGNGKQELTGMGR